MSMLFWDICQEHLDEAAFLFTQWERALRSPRLTGRDVAEGVEERLLAHVDGLVLGDRPVAERLLLPVIGDDEADPEVVCAAAYALLEGGLEGSVDAVVEAMLDAVETPGRLAALGRAAELSSAPLEDAFRPLLAPESPAAVAAAALRALAARGATLGDRLDDLIRSASPELAAAALGVAWQDPSPYRKELVEWGLGSDSAAVRDAALRAGLLMRLRPAWDTCVRAAEEKRPSSGVALAALAMGGAAEHVELVEGLLSDEALRAEALFALGFSGRARAVDACMPWLADKDAGALAAEVFSSIAGVAIDGPLRSEREEEDRQTEDLDANLVPGPEADLPLPAAEAVQAAWEKRRTKLRPELRYLGGEPLTAAGLSSAIAAGPMRRRALLALELAIRSQSPPVDTSRWARRQLAAQAAPRTFEERPFEAFFSR